MRSLDTSVSAPAGGTFFDRSMQLESLEPDLFGAEIGSEWQVFRGPNGGYLAALLLSAMVERADDPAARPRVLSVHYPKVPQPGPVRIRTRVVRAGRSVTWLAADLEQEGALCVSARATLSAERQGIAYGPLSPPASDLSPEQGEPAVPGMPRFTELFHYRSLFGTPIARDPQGRVGGFIRLREPRPYDAALLATLSDAWFPAAFAHEGHPVMAATLDLTVYFRDYEAIVALAPDAFAFTEFRSSLAAEGFFEEDGALWSPDGRLLAQSRQLALATPIGR